MARLALALTVFILSLSAGAYCLLVSRGNQIPTKSNTYFKDSPSDSFFYTSIGTSAASDNKRDDEPANNPKSPSLEGSTFTVELTVTSDRTAAIGLIDRLQTQGVNAYYTPLSRSGHVVYRVRHGIFTNKQDAEKAAAKLKVAAVTDAKVTAIQ